MALTALVYVPGLYGPFLFDDRPNLQPLLEWLNGTTGWQEVFLGNRSGLLGRPLSMLTFAINAKLFGIGPLSFKLTNLAIHLACGVLVYALLCRLLLRDTRLHTRAPYIALLITSIWLLHPLQVSTVLYIVQRMAQLSTLFMLLALLAYVQGRTTLEQGHEYKGWAWLFLGIPAATATAAFCKENGVLVPLLCAVIELGYFQISALTPPRPRAVKVFFSLSLILPMLCITAWLALRPEWLQAMYAGRSFTLDERLLSQPRALFIYMDALLLPRGPTLGLYTDDFVVSQSWLQPVSTILAWSGLAGLIGIALASRRSMPAVFTGLLFYFSGHLIESSIFPLEMVFEHRNYLPSVGFFLAVIGAIEWLVARWLAGAINSRRRQVTFIAIATCAMLGVATAARAWVWQSWSTIAKQGVQQHPDSLRARFDYLVILRNQNTPHQAQQWLDHLLSTGNMQSRHLAAIYVAIMQCQQHNAVDPTTLTRMASIAGSQIQLSEMQAFDQLAGYLRNNDCAGLSKIILANTLQSIADKSPQPQTFISVWRTRFQAADLYARGGEPEEAQRQGQKTWDLGTVDSGVGIFLAYIQIHNHDVIGARRTRAQLHAHIAHWDHRNLTALADIDRRLAK